MNKQRITGMILAALSILSGACRVVEVASLPRTFRIEIMSVDPSRYRVMAVNRKAEFAPVKPVRKGLYLLSIPPMDGGYSEVGCYRYNRHVPEEYPVLRIMDGEKVMREMSIRDIEKAHMVNGAWRINVGP